MYHILLIEDFSNQNIDNPGFWGAFYGAFFAFIFGVFTFYIQKKRERYFLHKNALVKIEHLLSEHYDEIDINKQHAKIANQIFAGYIPDANSTDNRFNLFRVSSEISLELASIDLINKYFEYIRSISRININMEAKNRALTRSEDVLINTGDIALKSKQYISSSMQEIFDSLNEIEEKDWVELLAYVRIYLNILKDNKIYPIIASLTNKWDLIISDELLEKIKTSILEGCKKE